MDASKTQPELFQQDRDGDYARSRSRQLGFGFNAPPNRDDRDRVAKNVDDTIATRAQWRKNPQQRMGTASQPCTGDPVGLDP
jgi:hypothetical protein